MRKVLTHWFWRIEINVVLLFAVVAPVLLPTLGKTRELQVSGVYHRQAIDIALKVTGFDKTPDALAFARRETLATDNTPLVHEKIIGHPLWRVTIANVTISTRDGKKSNPYIHAFDVLVDAETGQVFKITSLWTTDMEPKEELRSLISKQESDKNFRSSGRFPGGIPEDLPKVTFLQAVQRSEVGDIIHAKQIEGIYVIFSMQGGTQRPAWVIFHYGFPPHRISGRIKQVPADARTGAFNVIDATIGEWLLGGEGHNTENDYHK